MYQQLLETFYTEDNICSPSGGGKGQGREEEKEEEGEKNKKTQKYPVRRQKVKKSIFFSHLAALCLAPPAFPKGPWGCPLDHRSAQIQAIHRAPDLLPIHIGSWSKVKCANMTKKRVLQRVLRYYGGSTLPRCASGEKEKEKDSMFCRALARL